MSRITDLTILKEFEYEGVIYGFYWAKFEGEDKLFTRNGDTVKTVTHWFGKGDELVNIRDDVKQELLQEIQNIKN